MIQTRAGKSIADDLAIIRGRWNVVNHVQEKPLFACRQTIAMARVVYGIADANNKQLGLLRALIYPVQLRETKIPERIH